jgi:4-hydroxybenzoate polyprenyltransferase
MAARPASEAPEDAPSTSPGRPASRLVPVLLVRTAHPRQAALSAVALAVAAAVSGRAVRECGLVLVTVLVGQALLGWDNDLVDEATDRAAERTDKPLATGTLDRGTVGFALACAVLLVVPLSMSSGITAGLAYLLSLLVGVASNRWLRSGALSWVPWAVAFALYPAYLSYGGWGGGAKGQPPTVAMTLAAAVLGVGIHVLTSLKGLVEDNEAGRRHLPLRLALRIGAPRLLAVTITFCVLVVGAIAVIGSTVGLSR